MGEDVFISRTSDIAEYPTDGRSFVQAAIGAVVRAGRTPVDMSYFTARDSQPASYCQERVRGCPVYLALVGLRYGSLAAGLDVSHTELEFDEATEAGSYRLVFLIDEETPLPRRLIDRDSTRVDGFRDRLRRDANLVVKAFSSVADLDMLVYQALKEMPTGAGGGHLDRIAVSGGRPAVFAAARSAYLDRVVARYRRLDLEVLTPAEHEDHTPVLLQSVFVPQSVRAHPPPVELPKELRWLAEAGEIDEEDLPEWVDAQLLARVRTAYTERPALPVLDVVSARGNRLLVLLGDPGAGKSTLARYLVLTLAGGSTSDRLPELDGRLPLLVELRTFADLRGECPTFLEFLHRLGESEGLCLPRDLLESYLREDGRAMVVLDPS